jgi:hypothetical protein
MPQRDHLRGKSGAHIAAADNVLFNSALVIGPLIRAATSESYR